MSDAVEGLNLTISGDAATLTLNRPERRNALNQAMWRGLPAVLDQARAARVKVLVVTGAGGAFAAGADISEFEAVYATRASAAAYFGEIGASMDALAAFEAPTIARIEGACVGGGLGLALCCDLRIASANAKLGITPAKLGLMYPLSDTRRLVEAVGPSRAKDILYTGRILPADEALSIGLVDAVTGDVDAAVEEKTRAIAAASQWSARATKRVIRRLLDGQTADDADTEGWMLDAVEGQDFLEGRDAFLAKREALFPFR
ncbi:enoyl-CoA hydratase/isomerase family protein [Phenylobacterium sp.]|uniref:enoyl-CoA hydratase/isomerase family protein n=1 Tax=Phenylobacterium sp. TaxID=1871053 RepID=UPI0037C88A3B